mmetsp:Transcript_12996/g.18762  ORF Transcript_12996/g.18762 Transcript_12996/m.18762 type:complete len:823 (-) Transcript_12996:147-2615(-)|eukprot:CAMPEP_0195514138 /NCGR_PEP_ID=MMETSP0794_2-20130614/5605_1 /TAXON_ID=515487 /ORGANISM="Stephanopyxis turris, Strain CCMP 815" /LENGTH=822 /DNA_ID=CAMNT_0040642311 /DNA_START=117 /DNA_END=2585 /DNA_ORIENTATION=+
MRFHQLALSTVALLALTSFSGNQGFVRADEAAAAEAPDATATESVTLENAENFEFESDVSRMMDIVINSLYQNNDVFLRELISNASDALDKVRFLGITDPEMLADKSELEVRISYDAEAGTLTITDSGIGMTKADLVKNLGTIARSGTTQFLDALGDGSADMNMIGQFGVGFYSAFLVADRVTVASKHPSDPVQHIWESRNGEASFVVAPDARGNSLGRGTEITLHLKEDNLEYLDPAKIKELATHYSEFVTHPIQIRTTSTMEVEVEDEDDEEEKEEKDGEDLEVSEEEDADEDAEEKPKKTEMVTTHSWEQVNTNQAIWTRDKDSITEDEYQNFWKLVSKDQSSNATRWSHFNAEGNINFKSILYLPSEIPAALRAGMFDQQENGLKLYVRRVLISDAFELLPKYLSFVKGVVDSDDLPLNVNRESLQESKIIKVISKKLVRKTIEMIRKLSQEEWPPAKDEDEDEPEEDEEEKSVEEEKEHPYHTFYKKFGPSLKMGVMEDEANKSKLMKLLRFKSSKFPGDDDFVSLDEYIERKQEWQKEIYVFAGENVKQLEDSQFMERFRSKDVEVIYLTDPVDEYMIERTPTHGDMKFISITKENVEFKDEDADLVKRRDKAYRKKFEPLTKFLKTTFGKGISRVVVSKRLGEAPAIVSSASYTHSANMERILKAQAFHHGRNNDELTSARVFEINPRHPFIHKLLGMIAGAEEKEEEVDEQEFEASEAAAEKAVDAAWILHDMALLNSGFSIDDVKSFSDRSMRLLKSTMAVDSLDLEDEIDVPVEDDEPPEPEIPGMEGINMDDFNMDDFDMENLDLGTGEEL